MKSKSTDIRIAFDESTYLEADIEAKEEFLILPDNIDVKRRYLDDKERYLSITGHLGTKTDIPSRLKISSDSGEVWIKFVDPKI